jgi:hypothetical protein
MGLISDTILRQMMEAGKPKTITTTTESESKQTAKEPLDFGSMGLILSLLLSDLEKTKNTPALSIPPLEPSYGLGGPLGFNPLSTYSPPTLGSTAIAAPRNFPNISNIPIQTEANLPQIDPVTLMNLIFGFGR